MTTTMTTTIDLTHPVQVVTDPLVDGLGHRAECACGWAGPWQADQTDAEVDALDHPEVAVGPADGLDAVMGELLDLQDDLAAMVVWLAENWSADLPVPRVYGRGDDYSDDTQADDLRVELWAYCDPDQLVRISHLLGVPPTDDDAPDGCGNRYRNVRRAFGRVTLRAFFNLEHVETTP